MDVIARHPDRYRVFALTAATQVDALLAQCQAFAPRYAVMASEAHARQLADKVRALGLSVEVLAGEQSLCEVSSDPAVDAVMAAIVGAAGLAPSLAAARAGKKLLLANKEALVVGGDLFMQAVKQGGANLLPIDSEHWRCSSRCPTIRPPGTAASARSCSPPRAGRSAHATPTRWPT